MGGSSISSCVGRICSGMVGSISGMVGSSSGIGYVSPSPWRNGRRH